MDIRKLRQADAEALCNLQLRVLRDNPESFGASYEEILERGIAGWDCWLPARGRSEKRHKGLIWGMYVPQELRRKGIGKALLQAAGYAWWLTQCASYSCR